MLLLEANHLVKSYGTRTLFEADKLEIHDGDRIGLVGWNGTGKSTLLHILYGDEPCDSGNIDRRSPIALIDQLSVGAGTDDRRLLSLLSLSDSACKSGGERTRLALASAFSKNAPLLFADEPTTNLDLDGTLILQKMLEEQCGALVLVSHDRALLDALCTEIWAIEDGKVRLFPGNYSAWTHQMEREREFAQFEYEHYLSEKKRLEVQARKIREQADNLLKYPKHMGNSEARLYKSTAKIQQGHVSNRNSAILKRVEQMEEKERPSNLPEVKLPLGVASPIISKTAAEIKGLTVRYGNHLVLNNVGFTLPTGSHTALVGQNGAGKTTAADHLARGGNTARLAKGISIGYFSQNHDIILSGLTVLENVRDSSSLPEQTVRTILANLGIAGDDVKKPAGVLSGGERAKTALAKLLASDCNLLILDEPTNHIDLFTAEALENLLQKWQGTLLLITHDRRLIEHAAQRLLFAKDGKITTFEGNWAQWQEEEKRLSAPRDDMAELIDQLRRAGGGNKFYTAELS